MRLLKQSKNYNCGVFALQFLLRCFGKKVLPPSSLERRLGTTRALGTSHERMLLFLKDEQVISAYDASLEQLSAHLPAIVNYQYEDDGHYSVVLGMTPSTLILYNPWIGGLEVLGKADFYKSWYSNLYGNRWFLSLKE